jgi:hypothetical protein
VPWSDAAAGSLLWLLIAFVIRWVDAANLYHTEQCTAKLAKKACSTAFVNGPKPFEQA